LEKKCSNTKGLNLRGFMGFEKIGQIYKKIEKMSVYCYNNKSGDLWEK
jgi:hypothetical protein